MDKKIAGLHHEKTATVKKNVALKRLVAINGNTSKEKVLKNLKKTNDFDADPAISETPRRLHYTHIPNN